MTPPPDGIRCITVQQPWAWAIIEGGKQVENRTQLFHYRGPLAIHAGAQTSPRGFTDRRVLAAVAGSRIDSQSRWTTLQSDMHRELTRGAIIGLVDLVDCHHDTGCCRPWGESQYPEGMERHRRRVTHLVLENPRPLAQPLPCRGALGLWRPSDDVADQLDHELHTGT